MRLRMSPSGLQAVAATPEAYEHNFLWATPDHPTASHELAHFAQQAASSEPFLPVDIIATGLSEKGAQAFTEGFLAAATWYDQEADQAHEYPLCHAYRWVDQDIWFTTTRRTPRQMGESFAAYGPRTLENMRSEDTFMKKEVKKTKKSKK